ncbi:MAG: DUF6770 family protein [Bacteroidota bacterium]
MKKNLLLAVCSFLILFNSNAQSKVFKEVSDEISSQVNAIMQDGALVGYLMFTQLEKVSEDSFSYKISIMDENLNDIGVVNFREEKISLQSVAFEQDVLCLAYLKSNVIGQKFKKLKGYKSAAPTANNSIVTQFLNLEGKILKTNQIAVDIKTSTFKNNEGFFVGTGSLDHGIQLRNINQKGFALFYGDKDIQQLVTYTSTGEVLWKKNIDVAKYYSLFTTPNDIYMVVKKKDKMDEGGYEAWSYATADGKQYPNYEMKDKEGRSLKILSFDNDLTTGNLYAAGNIINPNKGNSYYTAKDVANGPYDGVFTISFNGHNKGDIKEVFTYWSGGDLKPEISTRGRLMENKHFAKYYHCSRDFNGNTYFAGTSFTKRPKIGAIVASVVFLPLLAPPILLAGLGYNKCYGKDAVILKQTPKGVLSIDNFVASSHPHVVVGRAPFEGFVNNKTFYHVTNSNTKSNYLIIDDTKNITLYNINKRQVTRTIPHKDGKIRTNVYPAKEGHILVSEYNQKEKYTRLSIEAL